MEHGIDIIIDMLSDVTGNEKAFYDDLTDTADLRGYGIDSISAITLAVEIEKKYKIQIKDDDLIIDNFISIKNIYEMIKRYLGMQPHTSFKGGKYV